MIHKIIDFCANFFEMIIDVFEWVLSGILYLLSELLYLFLDLFFTTIETVITSIDVAQVTALQSFADWGLLPDQIVYILYEINFAQCLTMLSISFLLRFTINLVPAAFTRI